MRTLLLIIFTLFVLIAISCSSESSDQKEPVTRGRWFTEKQFNIGKQVFTTYCASCHGTRAQGIVKDWKQLNPDGSFPAPPLDGSAHAWHHPISVLVRQIIEGGIKLGGTMPAFGDTLSDEEVIAAIAYFQSFWDKQTYDRWVQMNADQ
ncbi:c-type cytochrome [Halalkalibaculum sp. DA3122]|uniref:c-type cytochrome n=1 Tax=Halalkalibaculum sp. DA3122 TaxID=3373607 RepID=UPI003754335E